ncbi:MAG: hypothetical protein AAF433_16810 [Bacteroidota bacterium]
MSCYYSTLMVQTRAAAQERISVGLIMGDYSGNHQVHFAYSNQKLNLVRDLAGKSAFRALRWSLKQLENGFSTLNISTNLFYEDQVNKSIFSANYLSYLSRYQNNLLQFKPIIRLDLPCNESTFEWLFQEQVDNDGLLYNKEKRIINFENIRSRKIIQERFNSRRRVDQKVDPSILFPTYVDLLGKNGTTTYVKMISPNRKNRFLVQDASSFYSLAKQVDSGDFIVFSQEPNKNLFPKQHNTWETLRTTNTFKYFDTTDIQEFENYAIQKDVRPLFSKEEEE